MHQDSHEVFRDRLTSLLAQLDATTIGSMDYAALMQIIDSLVSAHLLDAIAALEEEQEAAVSPAQQAND